MYDRFWWVNENHIAIQTILYPAHKLQEKDTFGNLSNVKHIFGCDYQDFSYTCAESMGITFKTVCVSVVQERQQRKQLFRAMVLAQTLCLYRESDTNIEGTDRLWIDRKTVRATKSNIKSILLSKIWMMFVLVEWMSRLGYEYMTRLTTNEQILCASHVLCDQRKTVSTGKSLNIKNA